MKTLSTSEANGGPHVKRRRSYGRPSKRCVLVRLVRVIRSVPTWPRLQQTPGAGRTGAKLQGTLRRFFGRKSTTPSSHPCVSYWEVAGAGKWKICGFARHPLPTQRYESRRSRRE